MTIWPAFPIPGTGTCRAPGERTGEFRTGTDVLISDAEGQSRISAEDYAIAFVDEVERAAHRRQLMTVGY